MLTSDYPLNGQPVTWGQTNRRSTANITLGEKQSQKEYTIWENTNGMTKNMMR